MCQTPIQEGNKISIITNDGNCRLTDNTFECSVHEGDIFTVDLINDKLLLVNQDQKVLQYNNQTQFMYNQNDENEYIVFITRRVSCKE